MSIHTYFYLHNDREKTVDLLLHKLRIHRWLPLDMSKTCFFVMNSYQLGVVCLYALAFGRLAYGQAEKGERFLCTAIPIGADSCPVPPETLQTSSAQEEELRNTVMQLRETILQQQETIVNQLGTIKELTSKLTLCESASDESSSWRKSKQDTMDDVPRDPNDTVYNLGKTMQTLKDRLENLEVGYDMLFHIYANIRE